MKRIAIVVGVLVVGLAALIALAPLFVPTELVRDRLIEQIEQWTGRDVVVTGEPVISLYPWPTVTVEGVAIADSDGSGRPFITVDELKGSARLWPLFFGRVEMSEFELVRPRIDLRVDAAGRANWTLTGGTVGEEVAEALDQAPREADEVTLGRFIITGGTITYEVEGEGAETLNEVTLDIAWPSTSLAASASGSFVWRGERVELAVSLADPLELIGRRDSGLDFTLESTPLVVAFDGTIGRTGLDFRLAGTTDVAMTSLRHTLRWAGLNMVESPTLGVASISAEASWTWPMLSFTDAEMALDGNAATGAFTVDFSGERASIRGTIDADELDLTLYTRVLGTDVAATGDWRTTPINLPVMSIIDTDVRLSAAAITVGDAHIDRLAASAVIVDGEYVIAIGDAELYGGRLTATAEGRVAGPSLATRFALDIADMTIRPAFEAILGVTSFAGTGGASIRMAGEGATWGDLVRSLTGTFAAEVHDGALQGVDLDAAAAMTGPTVQSFLAERGETRFDFFAGDFRFSAGELIADRFVATGAAFDLVFAGAASLLEPAIAGEGWVWLAARGDRPELGLPFVLGGTWLAPILTEDAEPLVVPESLRLRAGRPVTP